MKKLKTLITLSLLLTVSLCSLQSLTGQDAVKSISAEEIKSHIYFLASDFMAGRVGPSHEYEIAAQYVAAQFAAAGIEPAVVNEDGTKSYFQGVPFARTVFGDEIGWKITKAGNTSYLKHNDDFKILFGSTLNHENLDIVYVGYGIEEPDNGWNDFKGLEVEGKIMICIGGSPVKKGKPVLPEEVNKKYTGPRGLQSKIMGLFNKNAAAIILVDVDGTSGMPYPMIPSQFEKEKYVYKGGESGRSSGMPSVYLAKPEIMNTLMGDSKFNPLANKDDILKNYKPQVLENTKLYAEIEIISEEEIIAKNIIGVVPGTDPELKDEVIVIGAHLDHVKPVMGQVCNGADDNASGSAGVIEIAEAVKLAPCKRTMVFITYTAEEMGLLGSKYFINSDLYNKDHIKFNLNMDMIGRSSTKNEESRAHYVVTNKKYVDGIEEFITDLNKGITDFPIIYDNDEDSPGGSDHQNYISEGIPAFFFFSGMHRDLHQPGDDPEKIDYAKAESISRLGYLIVNKLGNMETVPTFE